MRRALVGTGGRGKHGHGGRWPSWTFTTPFIESTVPMSIVVCLSSMVYGHRDRDTVYLVETDRHFPDQHTMDEDRHDKPFAFQ